MVWKNIVEVNIDTDREDSPISIGKPEPYNENMTKEEFTESIVGDMATLCEGLCTLIHVAEQQGLKPSAESLRDCIKHLEDGFSDASYKGMMANEIKNEKK
jgi:hypothetical protein